MFIKNMMEKKKKKINNKSFTIKNNKIFIIIDFLFSINLNIESLFLFLKQISKIYVTLTLICL
jgi:hypothetical protein